MEYFSISGAQVELYSLRSREVYGVATDNGSWAAVDAKNWTGQRLWRMREAEGGPR